jgi:hypothetical protein
MLEISVERNQLRIGKRLSVTFKRTLRIPDDGRMYPLPPGLRRFPICRVEDFAERVPPAWREHGGIFIPMYQREALWLAFDGTPWKPNAVQVAVGGINAVSGTAWDEKLSADPQNYIVCPDQPWLDGINVGHGVIRQFVAVPLGRGYTVEAQLTDREELGGIQIRAYEPKPGRFADHPPKRRTGRPAGPPMGTKMASPVQAGVMGLGAGGKMAQKIYPDPFGVETWDSDNYGSVFVHIINSEWYQELTGRKPPRSPISAKTYTKYGMPWFELYDEDRQSLAGSERLGRVKSVREKDLESGSTAGSADDESIEIASEQVKKVNPSDRGR